MSFNELYDHVQGLDTPVQLDEIRRKISGLLPGRPCRVVRSELNSDRLLGYYISARNEDTLFFGMATAPGRAFIVISSALNNCWSRFVEVKELMHLFDDPLSSTNSGEELETLLSGMCERVEPGTRTPQVQSEHECFWMAVALFCPEDKRVELLQRREAGSISDREIAEELKFPERCVPALFSSDYKTNIAYLRQLSLRA